MIVDFVFFGFNVSVKKIPISRVAEAKAPVTEAKTNLFLWIKKKSGMLTETLQTTWQFYDRRYRDSFDKIKLILQEKRH